MCVLFKCSACVCSQVLSPGPVPADDAVLRSRRFESSAHYSGCAEACHSRRKYLRRAHATTGWSALVSLTPDCKISQIYYNMLFSHRWCVSIEKTLFRYHFRSGWTSGGLGSVLFLVYFIRRPLQNKTRGLLKKHRLHFAGFIPASFESLALILNHYHVSHIFI